MERAARAAFGLRRRLRALGTLETSAGKVTLRMSQGMHSGEVHLFLVGTSHRELIVAGPGATAVTRMEKLAGAGEIAVSPATAARMREDWLGARRGQGRLLTTAPKGIEPGPSPLPELPARAAIEECLSREVRAHLTAGARQPEHRVVTTAFLRFDGTDALLARHGVDATASALGELIGDIQAAADEFEVCFLQSDVDADGGKVTLTAGAPRMVGDDEERMLLALRSIADRQPQAAAAHRRAPGQRLLRRHRRTVPARLHRDGRRREPLRAGHGPCTARRPRRHRRRAGALGHGIRRQALEPFG